MPTITVSLSATVPAELRARISQVVGVLGAAAPGGALPSSGSSAAAEALVLALDVNGEPLLAGWTRSSQALDSASTAQALVRLIAPALPLPAGTSDAALREALVASSRYAALLTSVDTALRAGRSPFSTDSVIDAGWQAALDVLWTLNIRAAAAATAAPSLAHALAATDVVRVTSLPQDVVPGPAAEHLWIDTGPAGAQKISVKNQTFLAWHYSVATADGAEVAQGEIDPLGKTWKQLGAYYAGSESVTELGGLPRFKLTINQDAHSQRRNAEAVVTRVITGITDVILKSMDGSADAVEACATGISKKLVATTGFDRVVAAPSTNSFMKFVSDALPAIVQVDLLDCTGVKVGAEAALKQISGPLKKIYDAVFLARTVAGSYYVTQQAIAYWDSTTTLEMCFYSGQVAPCVAKLEAGPAALTVALGRSVTFGVRALDGQGRALATPAELVVSSVPDSSLTVAANGTGGQFIVGGLQAGTALARVTDPVSGVSIGLPVTVLDNRMILALSASPNPAPLGREVTLGATVVPPEGASRPTGQVDVHGPDGTVLCSAALDLSGRASCPHSFMGVPRQELLWASYGGDVRYAPIERSSTTALTLTAPAVTATLTFSSNPAALGARVLFTAIVAADGASPGQPAPGGSVTFRDDTGTALCVASINTAADANGVAACEASLGGSPRQARITADYAGNTNAAGGAGYPAMAAVASGTLTLTAPASAPTALALTSNMQPALLDVPVVVSVTLNAAAGNASASARPTGRVSITDSAGNLLASGDATGVQSFVMDRSLILRGSPRVERLTANYAGDSVYAPTSAVLDLAVQRGDAVFSLRRDRVQDRSGCSTASIMAVNSGGLTLSYETCTSADLWTIVCTGSCRETRLCAFDDVLCNAVAGYRYFVATETVSRNYLDVLGRSCVRPATGMEGRPRSFDISNLNTGGSAFLGTSFGTAGTWAPLRAPPFNPAAPAVPVDSSDRLGVSGTFTRALSFDFTPEWKTRYDTDPRVCADLPGPGSIDTATGIVIYDTLLNRYQRLVMRSVLP